MKKQIRVYFTDFWSNLDTNQNFFTEFLSQKYDVVVDKENPEFVFYSFWGTNFLNYDCTKIFFSGENLEHNYNSFKNSDWAFSSCYVDSERHYRLPIYFYMSGDVAQLLKPKPPIEQILKQKTKFCNFIYSNPSCKKRNDFFHKLSKYKKIDSAGRYLNNVSFRVGNKIDFLRDYKFTFAFENSECEGYTTEKIYEPFVANSIPIYWGNPLVYKDFNTKSFLNYYDFANEDELIAKIIELDNNDDLYAQYISEPAFTNNELNEFVNPENVLAQFDKIFNSQIISISDELSSKSAFHKQFYKFKKILEFKKFRIVLKIKNFRFSKLKMKLQKLQAKS